MENCLEAFEMRSHLCCIRMHLDSSEHRRSRGVSDVPALVDELPCGHNVLEDSHIRACTLRQGNQLKVAEEIIGLR